MQDFKEAARLSAEAKHLALNSEAKQNEAADLSKQAASIDTDEQLLLQEITKLEATVSAAESAAGKAQHQLLQVGAATPDPIL